MPLGLIGTQVANDDDTLGAAIEMDVVNAYGLSRICLWSFYKNEALMMGPNRPVYSESQ